MPCLNPTDRKSLTMSIVDRYNSMPNLANVGGGNAQSAGKPALKATDMMSRPDKDFQTEVKIATDDSSNILYHYVDLKEACNINTTQYSPSGRG